MSMKSLGARTIGIAVVIWHCLISGAGFAQESAHPSLGEEFELAVHQTAQITDENISVTLQEVLEDSRCPVDVTCIWAGLAKVSLQVTVSGHEKELSLSTSPADNSTVFENYTFWLIGVRPVPRANQSIDRSAYFVTLRVDKGGQEQAWRYRGQQPFLGSATSFMIEGSEEQIITSPSRGAADRHPRVEKVLRPW